MEKRADENVKVIKKNPVKDATMVMITAMLAATIAMFSTGCASSESEIPDMNALTISTDNSATLGDMTIADVVDLVADTVVEIRTKTVTGGGYMPQYVTEGAGSGVIVSSDGYIVTNNHVIDGAADNITVYIRDDETAYPATLVATDAKGDIAILKINATGLDLKAATFIEDSDTLRVGQQVIAIGNPLGTLGGSVSEGILSALGREIIVEDTPMTLLQTTAAINPGNSGGGLFDMNGRLIAVVNAKSAGESIEGLGFAIPSNTVQKIISDLQTHGYTTGYSTVDAKFVYISDSFTLRYNGLSSVGVYVTDVGDASTNLQKLDLIQSVNGTSISSVSDLNYIIYKSEIGSTLDVQVYRNKKSVTVKVPVTEYIPTKSE